ncbi:G/U mismatch-specific DNA glycosylase [Amycolatopsis sp. NBC_01286]|uniref:G/U mismatch-specific DNA glycosylase n=1 Tax=Amycolatopsis sp. NBC_01286 TaxID=2903560 RepID=UPI002E12B5BC|nr:G/U mismatch-specific DNA glycosylase [Amycolatopsis sp. NBC_01286]
MPDADPPAALLPDVLADGLRVVFVGINPGGGSVAAGHSFHSAGNRFWPALYRAGFTPRLLRAEEERLLLGWGMGITSIVRRPTARASQLSRAEFVAGGQDLAERIAAIRPQWLAMLGVTGYRAAFAAPKAQLGPQPEPIGGARVWIVPNPSGLNAHYPPLALAAEFARMRAAIGMPDRSGVLGESP